MRRELKRHGKMAIGVDLGGTNIKAALVDPQRGLVQKLSVPTEADKGVESVVSRLCEVILTLAKNVDKTLPVVGIGSPGVVSRDRTTVLNPPNLPGWNRVVITKEVRKRTGLEAIVENDANLAALGSSRYGAGRAFDSMILLTLGTGVGGGIIYERKLFRGASGGAGELGHVIIDYHGPSSNSNTRGGIEAYLGQRFLSRYAADQIRAHSENPLHLKFKNKLEELEPLDLYHAAEEGNRLAIEILCTAGERLGIAIVNYIHILDIRKIILSGGVANAGHWLAGPAYSTAIDYLMPPFHDGFEILYEPLGNDAALYGAATLALEEL